MENSLQGLYHRYQMQLECYLSLRTHQEINNVKQMTTFKMIQKEDSLLLDNLALKVSQCEACY